MSSNVKKEKLILIYWYCYMYGSYLVLIFCLVHECVRYIQV